jgi:hypothetical protein
MASYQSRSEMMASGPNKITKSRSKAVVKPILKKLSHSEKNSLDLDRGWEEQIHYGGHGWGGGGGGGGTAIVGAGAAEKERERGVGGIYEYGSAGRSARDVTFSLSATDLHGEITGSGSRRKFTHARSTSGTSGISVATTGSGHGHRNGERFVHPFQQTPRTSTPPLSYANSLASFDTSINNTSNTNNNSGNGNNGSANGHGGNGNGRDYSPTITEDDDDLDQQGYAYGRSHHLPPTHAQTHPYPSSLRRPSLASQRTSSLSDISAPPPLRINTANGRSAHNPSASVSSRLAHGILTSSRSDLQLNLLSTSVDSPATTSNTTPAVSSAAIVTSPPPVASPSSSVAQQPLSPLRSSLDMAASGFRIRSRSEVGVDSAARQEGLRQARRKFEEKEKLKDEKWAREQVRKREDAATKEANKFFKTQEKLFKESGRSSTSTDVRPTASRKNTPPTAAKPSSVSSGAAGKEARKDPGKGSGTFGRVESEKGLGFQSRKYDSTMAGQTPRAADEVVFQQAPRRSNTAKQKTQGAWTSFILWLKIKILRMGKS